MINFYPLPEIDIENCPLVSDVTIYPMDEFRNDIAAGKTSIQSTLYSTLDNDIVHFEKGLFTGLMNRQNDHTA